MLIDVRRVAAVATAGASSLLWLAWIMLAVALAPLAGTSNVARDVLGLGNTAFCNAQWIEVAQLVPAIVAIATPIELVRAARRPAPKFGAVLLAVVAFALLALTWWIVVSAGDCATGSDD